MFANWSPFDKGFWLGWWWGTFSMAIMVSQPPWWIHTEHLAPDVFQRAPLNLQHDAGTWATHEARSASSALAVGGRLIHEGDR